MKVRAMTRLDLAAAYFPGAETHARRHGSGLELRRHWRPYAKNQWRANQRRQGSVERLRRTSNRSREKEDLRGTGRRKDPGYTPAELCA